MTHVPGTDGGHAPGGSVVLVVVVGVIFALVLVCGVVLVALVVGLSLLAQLVDAF